MPIVKGCSQFSSNPAVQDPLELFRSLVRKGEVQEDPKQLDALKCLSNIHQQLHNYDPPLPRYCPPTQPQSWISTLFKQFGIRNDTANISTTPLGMYLYGGVGCGKTMMLDMFFSCAQVKRKRDSPMAYN